MSMTPIKNRKIAWITGGGTGIGRDLAVSLSKNGFLVIVSGRRIQMLSKTSRLNPKNIIPMKLDVSKPDDCLKISKKIYNKFGFIDLVILNAATYSPGEITKIIPKEISPVININLMGPLNCLSYVLERMKKEKSGQIVFISSPAGFRGLPGGGIYGVTKSALTFLAETLKTELCSFNIKVQVVHPGFIKTPMTDKNKFHMPFLMTTKEAAKRIICKLSDNDFEISFPKRLIYPMKILAMLPNKIYFFLVQKFIKPPEC